MKILWIKSDFLHPTERGGQIRTLKMLEQLHREHEIHYLAFHDPANPIGLQRAGEYSTRAWPIEQAIPHRRSAQFVFQALANLASRLPLVITRYQSEAMRQQISRLTREHGFDAVVCDFLFPAINVDALDKSVIFQHNVESIIWRRHVEQAADPMRRFYFGQQASRLWRFEKDACRRAAHVIAVSEVDAQIMRQEFGIANVSAVPTGVDIDELTPPAPAPPTRDIVFVGSMDWMPNSDGIEWFLDEILPLIRQRRPNTTVTIVGRKPAASLIARAEREPGLTVTGTVPDVRPYLWESAVSVVPLRVGSGTRLKIYEAMAAKVPVISTTIGAEGLDYDPGTMRIADTPQATADACLALLADDTERRRQAQAAWEMVRDRYSWRHASQVFSGILERANR